MGEKTDSIAKVDMVITHISDCILELDNRRPDNRIPEMASALAAVLRARMEAVIGDKQYS